MSNKFYYDDGTEIKLDKHGNVDPGPFYFTNKSEIIPSRLEIASRILAAWNSTSSRVWTSRDDCNSALEVADLLIQLEKETR